MGYPQHGLVKAIIAQALTSATPDTLDTVGPLLTIGRELDTNLITNDLVATYIRDSDADVDAQISGLYATPLKPIVHGETKLLYDISEYGTEIVVASVGTFNPGDVLVVQDGTEREEIEILSILGKVITPCDPLAGTYSAKTTRVARIKYPDPIPFVSARIAAANIYDKYFAAEAQKNESTFGKHLRNLAQSKINEILAGVIILYGQKRVGTLTTNPNLLKRYGTPEGMYPEHYKEEKESR